MMLDDLYLSTKIDGLKFIIKPDFDEIFNCPTNLNWNQNLSFFMTMFDRIPDENTWQNMSYLFHGFLDDNNIKNKMTFGYGNDATGYFGDLTYGFENREGISSITIEFENETDLLLFKMRFF